MGGLFDDRVGGLAAACGDGFGGRFDTGVEGFDHVLAAGGESLVRSATRAPKRSSNCASC